MCIALNRTLKYYLTGKGYEEVPMIALKINPGLLQQSPKKSESKCMMILRNTKYLVFANKPTYFAKRRISSQVEAFKNLVIETLNVRFFPLQKRLLYSTSV